MPLRTDADTGPKQRSPWELAVAPSPDHRADWTELDPAAWPERHFVLRMLQAWGVDGQLIQRGQGELPPGGSHA